VIFLAAIIGLADARAEKIHKVLSSLNFRGSIFKIRA
jgi:hypothetical protein